jgi:HPt (histidine-containing phosphotransfer) domain-containing protein
MIDPGREASGPAPFPAEGPIPVEIPGELFGLIPTFLENRRKDIERLREALGAADVKTIEDLAHQLKGLGGGYGFAYITTAGAAIESLAREERLSEMGPWMVALEDYLARILPRRAPDED